MSDTDVVEHPQHYTSHPSGVECIQVTEHMGFNLGNAVKYIWRCDLKQDAIEDLRKARWYIDREIAKREKDRAEGFVFPTEPHSVISAQGHPCHDTDETGRTRFVLTGAERWMCDCSTWPETTIRQDLTDHRNEATI